ncbi:hypothetical protein GUJ93_ZPchr0001g31170 [Zizania palustris]|uniref:Transcription repressor n=1 Tax=Zizania palustris TaxID=103762 RepID=A0A8J5VTP8_ZIZPA|nr:hypothetical protein GUJ93_ZPchr0001g31170 [Zizania palustris]
MVIGRLALGSLFHNKARDTAATSPPAPAAAPPLARPSCKDPKTQSSRAAPPPPAAAMTIASIFFDSAESSSFTASSARHDCSDSLSTASEASAGAEAAADTADADAVVRGLIRPSDRLLFDPGASCTSSILEEKSPARDGGEAFVGGVAVAFESEDPYVDFRESMEEMVAAHGVGRDWSWLEEMLVWYLRANGKGTHAAIVAAFIDVIVAIADPVRASCTIAEESPLKVAEKAKLTVL